MAVNEPINEMKIDYEESSYNLKTKIKKEKEHIRNHFVSEFDTRDLNDEELPIDLIFPQTIDQHSNRIDSWRSYNSDLDKHDHERLENYSIANNCCSMLCCCCSSYTRYRAKYYSWPLWWLLYHLSCCCCCAICSRNT